MLTETSQTVSARATNIDAPLRVVCLYPAFDPKVNELALVYCHLAAQGTIDCRVIAGSADPLKGFVGDSLRMDVPGLSIRRVQGSIMKGKLPRELLDWTVEHEPDVIVCGEPITHLGHTVRKATRAPLVLHTENWLDHRVLLNRRYYLGIPFLRRPVQRVRRTWMGWGASKVIVACPVEARTIKGEQDLRVFVPWPHPAFPGAMETRQPIEHKARTEIVCIGSVARWKGSEVMVRYIAKVLEQLKDVQVRIIGPAIDRTSELALESLAPWKDRCTRVNHLGRNEALTVIGQSLCLFNPIALKGWGSIGDAWNMAVPLVSVAEHYALVPGENALVALTAEDFVAAIRSLRNDEGLWKRLALAGHQYVTKTHSTETVAQRLLVAIRNASKPPDGNSNARLAR